MEINKSHLEIGKCSWMLEKQVAKPLEDKFSTFFKGKEETFEGQFLPGYCGADPMMPFFSSNSPHLSCFPVPNQTCL